jgi:hypothetical protein
MKEFIIMLVHFMSEDAIIEELQSAINLYRENPEEGVNQVGALCLLFSTKQALDTKGGEGLDAVFKMNKEINDIDRIISMYKNSQQ